MGSSANPQQQETTQRPPQLRSNTKNLNPKPTHPPIANRIYAHKGVHWNALRVHLHMSIPEHESVATTTAAMSTEQGIGNSRSPTLLNASGDPMHTGYGGEVNLEVLKPTAVVLPKGPNHGEVTQSLRRGREGPGSPTDQKPPAENPNEQHQQENTRSTNHSPELQVPKLAVKGSCRRPLHLSSHGLGAREAKNLQSVGGGRPVERGRRQNSMDECAHCSGTGTAHEAPPPVPGSGAG